MAELAETLPDGLEPQGDTWAYVAMPGQVANSLAHLTTLVDECKLHVDSGRLHTTHVDPANVAMGDLSLQLDSDLGVYQADAQGGEFTAGIPLDWLRQRLLWARVGRGGLETGDDVHLLLDQETRKAHVQVERAVTRTSSRYTIDPDAIRQEPDIPNLDLPCQAEEVAHNQLYQAVQAVKQETEHARVSGSADGSLIIEGEGDRGEEHVAIPEVVDTSTLEEGASSLFSIDYLWSIAKALKAAKPERITVNWGTEFPTKIRYHHSEWGIEGQFMLAPRIQSD